MNADQLRELLAERDVTYEEIEIQYGIQFRCDTGEIFNVYESGAFTPGGQTTDLTKELVALAKSKTSPAKRSQARPVRSPRSAEAQTTPAANPVFIVYGHDKSSLDALELMLRRFGLDPVILQALPVTGDTIIEKLEQYLGEHGNIGYACVLLTPDDEGHRAGTDGEKKYRARQNVVLELGMVLAKLGRHRVAILHKQTIELPSDIAGLIYLGFAEHIEEIKSDLFRSLQEANYQPDSAGLH